jgi:S1-C subfamily serine protease
MTARFTIVEAPGATRVQATDVIESENVLGVKRSHEGVPRGDPNATQELLISIGGRYPAGTEITGYDLGFSVRQEDYALLVGEVAPGSTAASNGVLEGDRIRRVNGKGFGNNADRFRELANATPPGSQVALELQRDGQRITISFAPGIATLPSE